MPNIDIWQYVARLLVVLFLLPAHEAAHAFAAYRLGDPTAKRLGRLTLNPRKHIDPIGFLMILAVGVGWAKPVPVNPQYFKNPRRDFAIVSAAGPVSNFILAFLLIGIVVILPSSPALVIPSQILQTMAYINISLGVFNLLPIPPFDGFNIFGSFLPEQIYSKIMQYQQYAFPIVLLFVWTGLLDGPLAFLTRLIWNGFVGFFQLFGLI